MKSTIAALLLLIFPGADATPQHQTDSFGAQLDCATAKALHAYSLDMSESSRVRRAVDACIASTMPQDANAIRTSMRTTVSAIEARREDLVEATKRRLQLCRDAGIAAESFSTACPRLFVLEEVKKKRPGAGPGA